MNPILHDETRPNMPLPLAEALAACDALVTSGQPDAALRLWAWLRTQTTRHSGPWLRAASALTRLGRYAEAEALLLEAHAAFPDGVLFAFIEYGRAVRQASGPRSALAPWAMVRERFPHQPHGYVEAAACLRELKEFEAAGALLRDAQARFPGDLTTAWEYAKLAELTADWPVALERWAAMRDRFPDHWAGYGGSARALLQLKRQEDADALLRDAAQRFPDEVGLLPDLARSAEARRDWQEALGFWNALKDRVPDRPEFYLRSAKCLTRLGEIEEAEQLMLEGAQRFPKERWFLFEYAQIAESLHHYETAIERWRKARDTWPEVWHPYGGLANCMRNLKNYPDAQSLLIDCLDRFPNEPGPLIGLANLIGRVAPAERRISVADLHARIDAFMARHGVSPGLLAARATVTGVTQDWKSYHDQLAAAVRQFPHDTVLGSMFAAARELHFDEEAQQDGVAEPPPEPRNDGNTLTISQILANFDSLGGGRHDGDATRSYGCEFGLIQRDAGIEPLSLLRWSATAPEDLIRLLDQRMEGIGNPKTLHVSLTNSDEWGFVDRAYNVSCNHTNMFGASVARDAALRNISTRQKFLARKLLTDLEEARKIFVYRVLGPSLDEETLDRLFVALRRYGPNTLLYVRTADEVAQPFTVQWVRPGLMVGYIDWFRDGEKNHTANVSGWRRVCSAAFNLWQQAEQGLGRELAELSIHPSALSRHVQ